MNITGMNKLDRVLHDIDRGLPASLDRLFRLLRFPSVGTDPRHGQDCVRAAQWLASELKAIGFDASVRDTSGQPAVVGKYRPEAMNRHVPHILFYGHYDVQPADPLDLWESPPFEPQIRKGKDGKDCIFARGVADDKGQLMTFLEASRAWLRICGSLPFRLTVLLEGDEEGDSTPIDRFIARNRAELKADTAFVCDTELWNRTSPAIVTRLRGCICDEVEITGPRIDLHSGYYGGPAVNPIRVLSGILAGMHDKKGKIAIPGFHDGMQPIPLRLRRQWRSLGVSGTDFLANVGLRIPAGEQGFSVLEQIWGRPTAEINGIWGGYTGAGTKTVLPSKATAKVSFRLVEGQKPADVRRAFRTFVKSRLPKGCKARFTNQGGDAPAIAVSAESPWIEAARRALTAEWQKETVLVGCGASIPVVESFKRHLGIDSLLIGFTHDDDGFHAPNEKYGVERFHKGMRSWARIIAEFA